MNHMLPRSSILRVSNDWNESPLDRLDWNSVSSLPPLWKSDGSGLAIQQTQVRVCHTDLALFVRFDCEDRDIWGTMTNRDDPIYDQEVVEVFLAPGSNVPIDYFEFEVSPNGVLLDLTAHNPTGDRKQITVDFAWNCEGIRWQAERDDSKKQWWASLMIPWASMGAGLQKPATWRANFYRIERPRGEDPEFSCWSPTLAVPADFHRPSCFGFLDL